MEESNARAAARAAEGAAWVVDTRNSLGVQVGNNNVQHVCLPPTEVEWPVRVGLVPQMADCHQDRHETGILRDAIRSGRTAVVTQVLAGLGGVGKSQLAAAFAREREDELDLLVWADARSRDAIVAGYAQAAEQLGYQRPDNVEDAARWFLGWLRRASSRSWLIVLDDLADPADLKGFWPTGPSGSTIVTTRRTDAALTAQGRQRITVGLFSLRQALRYLAEKLAVEAGSPLLNEADRLVEDLQFLPLALAQAAAFMLDRGETCSGYRRRFTDQRRALTELFPSDALADDYEATVATTWAISIEVADALPPIGLSRPLLEVVSMLSPSGFPQSVLSTPHVGHYIARHAASSPDGTTDGARAVTELDCRDALSNLARLSIVTIGRAGDGDGFVSVHALVQRATYEQLDPQRRHELAWRTASSLLQSWPDTERDLRLSQALRSSAETLIGRSQDALWLPYQHPLLRKVGASFGQSGLLRDAVDFWRKLCETSTRLLTAEHLDVLINRHEYAHWLKEAEGPARAIHELEQLLADEIRLLDLSHPELLRTRHSFATALGEAGHFTRALVDLEKLLPDRIKVHGAYNRHTLSTRGNIARFRGECGNPAAAATEYSQLLKDRMRALGPNDIDTLQNRGTLAYWKAKAGSPRRASKEFSELAEDYARILHPTHPETLGARHDAAKWLGVAGDASGAAAALKELVDDEVRELGVDHPETIGTRGSHADWVGAAGDASRAVALLEDVVVDAKRVFGANDLDTFNIRTNLAHWTWKANERADAILLQRQLLTDMRHVLSEDNPRVVAASHNLAAMLRDA